MGVLVVVALVLAEWPAWVGVQAFRSGRIRPGNRYYRPRRSTTIPTCCCTTPYRHRSHNHASIVSLVIGRGGSFHRGTNSAHLPDRGDRPFRPDPMTSLDLFPGLPEADPVMEKEKEDDDDEEEEGLPSPWGRSLAGPWGLECWMEFSTTTLKGGSAARAQWDLYDLVSATRASDTSPEAKQAWAWLHPASRTIARSASAATPAWVLEARLVDHPKIDDSPSGPYHIEAIARNHPGRSHPEPDENRSVALLMRVLVQWLIRQVQQQQPTQHTSSLGETEAWQVTFHERSSRPAPGQPSPSSLEEITTLTWVANLDRPVEHVEQDSSSWPGPPEVDSQALRSLFREIMPHNWDSAEMVDVVMVVVPSSSSRHNNNKNPSSRSTVLGQVPRPLVHIHNLLHRGVGILISQDVPLISPNFFSSSSFHMQSSRMMMPALYVHQRTAHKRLFPSLYDMFVGGVSEAGEPSWQTAAREVQEELGLSAWAERGSGPWFQEVICTAYNRCVVDVFTYTMNSTTEPVTWQPEEVAWGCLVPYQVVCQSAFLSKSRLIEAGQWPGPPVASLIMNHPGPEPLDQDGENETWAATCTWDYVPDGLLVWEGWLRYIQGHNGTAL